MDQASLSNSLDGDVEFERHQIRCCKCGRTDECVVLADEWQSVGSSLMCTTRRAPDGWGFVWRDAMPAWECPDCIVREEP